MSLLQVELDDKYTKDDGRIYLTGIQALVRLPMIQHQLDAAAGRRTAGYISGYRGSPLGNFDQQLAAAGRYLDAHHIKAQPGVNEDLAATALWGTQQVNLFGDGAYDGVFGMWYGKGPGVDRTGDVFRHANLAGTAPLGGVLVLMGDDHTCESSTTAHQSEYGLVDAMIPILNPAGVAEILQFGLIGFALSRFSGCWVGVKCVHDTVNTAASIEARVAPDIVLPDRSVLPPEGLNIRWPDTPLAQEARLHLLKHDAVKAFVLANQLDRLIHPTPRAKVGVISTGKSHLDLMQALDDLGIDGATAKKLGLRVLKLGLTYPIAAETVRAFAKGLKQIIVVEEKRGLIETQVKEILYGVRAAPSVVGKKDEDGNWLFPSNGALSSNQIAEAIGSRLLNLKDSDDLRAALGALDVRKTAEAAIDSPVLRTPYFCSGCPHNTSTRVPDGSTARAGIGCHYMAQWMDRDNQGYTQMGGEGASWIGEAPFSKRRHMFQNIGDGTYYHSGLMAIRAAIASKVNITFKILYNDAVAMTGGQPVDGPLTVPQISRQVAAEGAEQIVVVTDEPEKYPLSPGFAPGVTVRHRDELDQVQRELREVEGTTVLIYDQTCAAEKRRRRKRGQMVDPPKRVMINEAVCEGCGDCGEVSNCVSILPLETEFGRKRQIDQSSCNKDFSCLKGFCPSFVTVEGAGGDPLEAQPKRSAADDIHIPDASMPEIDGTYGIVIAGVGGTGVVTIGALLGMAAHLEGKGAAVLDMTGLAQKGGPVMSHLRIAASPDHIQTTRIASGGAQLLLGCDLMVAGGKSALVTVDPKRGHIVANDNESITGDFTRNADMTMPGSDLRSAIAKAAGSRAAFVAANRLATALLGDAIGTNLFMVGYAYQRGLLPVSAAAIERAIALNRVAVEMNRRAFRLGRLAAHDPAAIEAMAAPPDARPEAQDATGLDPIVERRAAYLTAYQDAAYADRYRRMVARVRAAEADRAGGMHGLAEAVARYYFKLLAYKDEYEVARLYTDDAFQAKLAHRFKAGAKVSVHLAPPLLARRDPVTGHPLKKAYGPWIFTVFKGLARLKALRGTPFDPFGYTAERRAERQLITHYESLIVEILTRLDHDNHGLAVEIASLPEQIRGFGHVKERHREAAKAREAALLDAFRQPTATLTAAE